MEPRMKYTENITVSSFVKWDVYLWGVSCACKKSCNHSSTVQFLNVFKWYPSWYTWCVFLQAKFWSLVEALPTSPMLLQHSRWVENKTSSDLGTRARLFLHRETKATITQQFMHACMRTHSHTHTHTFWWYTQYKVTWLLCRELSVHWQSTNTSCWNTMWPFLCVEEDQTIRRDCVSWEKLVRAQFTSDNVWLYDKSSTLPSVSFPSHPSLGMRHQRNIHLGRHELSSNHWWKRFSFENDLHGT